MIIQRLPFLFPPILQLYIQMNIQKRGGREVSSRQWLDWIDHRMQNVRHDDTCKSSGVSSLHRRSEIFIFLTSSSYFLVQEICSSRLARQPDGIHTALRTRAHSKTLLPKCIGMHHVPCRFSWRAEVILNFTSVFHLPALVVVGGMHRRLLSTFT